MQTCLKRIRLDLPIIHEDFVGNNDEVGENNDRDITVAEIDPFLRTHLKVRSLSLNRVEA